MFSSIFETNNDTLIITLAVSLKSYIIKEYTYVIKLPNGSVATLEKSTKS